MKLVFLVLSIFFAPNVIAWKTKILKAGAEPYFPKLLYNKVYRRFKGLSYYNRNYRGKIKSLTREKINQFRDIEKNGLNPTTNYATYPEVKD